MRHGRTAAGKRRQFGAYFVLVVAFIISVLPLFWVLLTSVKTHADALAYPPTVLVRPTFAQYQEIFSSSAFLSAAINSIVITTLSVMLAITVAFSCAYALVRLRVPGRRLLVLLITLVLTMPGMALVVPLFYTAVWSGLYDTHLLLTLVYAALLMPFSTLIIVAYLRRVPIELEQAASVDGASRLQAIWHVLLPIARPGIGAAAIFAGIGAWNEYLFPVFLTRSTARPLTVWVTSNVIGLRQNQFDLLSASTMVIILPIVVIVVLLQRNLIAGLTAGSLKE